MKVVFFGTSQFAAQILAFLLERKINIVAVVTRADKPQGRALKIGAPPVKELAVKLAPHLPILQPLKASTPEFADLLKTFHPDLFVVASYGEILKQFILDIPPHGAINAHASLLPKYRGAAPIQRCLMKGETETGVTVMKMVLEMDAGDILASEKIPLNLDINYQELQEQLAALSSPLLLKVLDQIVEGTLHPTPQDHSRATFAPKITAIDTEIRFDRTAFEIHNQIRALSPHPGAWCWVELAGQKKKLKIQRSQIVSDQQGDPTETLAWTSKDWMVACQTGALKLLQVQLEGKKSLPIDQFLRGMHESCKIIF